MALRVRSIGLAVAVFARSAAADEPQEIEVRDHRQLGAGFVSKARIEDEPREVTDAASLVEPLPGVHVRRLGADDSFASLSIRGSSSTEVAIYLAGVPLSGGADPTLDLATLPLWPGAEARVYRSFAPATMGPGSLGGTLAIDPPSPRSKPKTDVWAAIGSFGARRIRIGDVRGDPDGVRIATGFSASRSDDDFSYLDRLGTQSAGHDVYTTRANAGHAAASGLASIAMPLHAGGSGALTITTLAQARRQEIPGTADAPTPEQRLDSSRLLAALELADRLGGGTFGIRGWARRETLLLHDSLDDATRITLGPTATDDTIVAAGGSISWKGRPTDTMSIDVRVDASSERYAPGTWVGAATPPGATRNSFGAGVDLESRAIDRLTLGASARGDAWFDGGADGEARPAAHVGFDLDLAPVVVSAHGGVVQRPASFVERYGDHGAFIGDPSLRPESAETIDLGARFDRRSANARFNAELAGFATWADDLITFVSVGAKGKAKAENIGQARIVGLEATARGELAGFDTRVSFTELATENESACNPTPAGCDHPALPGRPTTDLVFDLGYTIGFVHLRYGLDAIAGTRADDKGTIVVPDRILHGAGIRSAVPGVDGLVLALDIRNLFDARVAEYAGVDGPVRAPIGDIFEYPLPGRSFLASARFTR